MPAKADDLCAYCDRWYLVVSDVSIVGKGELPPTWGLMAPPETDGRGNVLPGSTKLERQSLKVLRRGPEAWNRSRSIRLFVAAILRRAAEERPGAQALRDAHQEGYLKAVESRRAEATFREQSLPTSWSSLKRNVADFEQAAGVRIQDYQGEHIGAAVKEVLYGKHQHARKQFTLLKDQVARLHESLQALPEEEV